MTELDARIRAAMARVTAEAPAPPPFPDLGATPSGKPHGRRWRAPLAVGTALAVVAVGALIVSRHRSAAPRVVTAPAPSTVAPPADRSGSTYAVTDCNTIEAFDPATGDQGAPFQVVPAYRHQGDPIVDLLAVDDHDRAYTSSGGTIWVVDMASRRVLAHSEVGGPVTAVALAGDGRLYATTAIDQIHAGPAGSNRLVPINSVTGQAGTPIVLPAAPLELFITADGHTAYIDGAATYTGTEPNLVEVTPPVVMRVDLRSATVTIIRGHGPSGESYDAVSPDGSIALSAHPATPGHAVGVAVIDARTGAQMADIAVPVAGPIFAVVPGASGPAYLVDTTGNPDRAGDPAVYKLDLAARRATPLAYLTGTSGQLLTLSPDGRYLWIEDNPNPRIPGVPDQLVRVDTTSGAALAPLGVASCPLEAIVSPRGARTGATPSPAIAGTAKKQP